MPYCSKCSTELVEDVMFCPNCGTPVSQSTTKIEDGNIERRGRRRISALAIVLIAVLVSAVSIVTIVFLPVRAVDASESRDVLYQTGLDTVNFDFHSDVARIYVAFEDLDGKLVTLQMSIAGRVGVLAPSNLYDLSFEKTVIDNVLTVTSELNIVDLVWPSSLFGLNVTCDIRIDRSMNTSLNIKTSVGKIDMSTQSGVILNSLSLETTTGEVEAILAPGVIISGDVSIKSTTGRTKLNWNRVIVIKDSLIDVETTTGGVDVEIKQDDEINHTVTLNAEATTGGVNFNIDVQGTIGAKIRSSVSTGGINIERQVGFSGTESLLMSNNYPANNNFDVSLNTTTGGIDIDAKYTP